MPQERYGFTAQISPGVTFPGGVRVGDSAFVGAGAVALPGRRIGVGAVVGAGAYVELDEGRNNFVAARVSLGAVAPKPLYIAEAGASLAGKAVNPANIEAAAKIAQDAATPISDMRGTAEYRKHLSAVMARRAIEKAVERARGI